MGVTQPHSDYFSANEKLSAHTSWRVGGVAKVFYRPPNLMHLMDYLQTHQETFLFLGLGSNLLVRDGGYQGTVIATRYHLTDIQHEAHTLLYAETGASSAKVAKTCEKLGYNNLSFLAGIPGTIGGALAMNAGAFKQTTWEQVKSVDTIDKQGKIKRYARHHFTPGYRNIDLAKGQYFIAVHFYLKQQNEQNVLPRAVLLRQRHQTQPIGKASCGSVFTNPLGDYAGRLIEHCGLKGTVIGDAQVSEKHANFIINRGKASAWDIEKLIDLMQKEVIKRYAIQLIPEVRIIGEYREGQPWI